MLERPRRLLGTNTVINTGHGPLVVNVTNHEGKPVELFLYMRDESSSCDRANAEAIARLVSLHLRSGGDLGDVVETLQGLQCCPAWDNGHMTKSMPDAASHVLKDHVFVEDTDEPTENEDQPVRAYDIPGEDDSAGPGDPAPEAAEAEASVPEEEEARD